MNVTQPVNSPIAEQCTPNALAAGVCQDNFSATNPVPDPAVWMTAPAGVLETPVVGLGEGRLIASLRGFATSMNPVAAPQSPRTAAQGMMEAAVQLLLAVPPGVALSPMPALPQAFADLVVTGRHALNGFFTTRPTAADVIPMVAADPRTAGIPQGQITEAVKVVFSRVHAVMAALLGDSATRMAQRPALGWIAVSGEDDLPMRPVNISSQGDPQYNMEVTVPFDVNQYNGGSPNVVNFVIQTRLTIASSVPPGAGLENNLGFTVDAPPALPPNGPVFLYMHGHMSRLEEAGDLICAFKALATNDMPITVISMDLPGMGYATSPIDADQPMQSTGMPMFPPTSDINYNTAYPYLDFIAAFIVAFVNELDADVGLASRLTAIIGGSLGGHLGLRFSTVANQFPWIRNIVTWSPISAGGSVTENPLLGWLIQHQLRGNSDQSEVASTNSGQDSRAQYFNNVFDQNTTAPLPVLPPQPEMWYRDDWTPCKSVYMTESRLERREIYRAQFRQWHWRVALECVLFSFLDAPNGSTMPRYQSMTGNMLLLSGSKDNYFSVYIFTSTRVLSTLMTNAPGTTLFLLDTGHSIHNERPRELASAILSFVGGTPPAGVASPGFCQFTGSVVVTCLSWAQSTSATCSQGYNQTTQQCTQQEQQSSQQCSQQEQQSTTSCTQQQQQSQSTCTSWGPFSFLCTAWNTVVSWVCIAWSTVVNWVCVAWTTVTNWVCVAWAAVTNFVCQVWSYLTTTVCSFWNTVTVWVCG